MFVIDVEQDLLGCLLVPHPKEFTIYFEVGGILHQKSAYAYGEVELN